MLIDKTLLALSIILPSVSFLCSLKGVTTCLEKSPTPYSTSNEKGKLSFSKNQKLNFIFGSSMKAPIHNPSKVSAICSPSEIKTPKLNILPTLPQCKERESTYEEVDMKSESSGENNEEKGLSEVKAKLNEIAQQMRPKFNTKDNEIDSERKSKQALTERTVNKLMEYKRGIELLNIFSESLDKIENATELSEKEKQIQFKLSIAYIRKTIQSFSTKDIETDIKTLRKCDNESITTSETLLNEEAHLNKYKALVKKVRNENLALRTLVAEVEDKVEKPKQMSKKRVVGLLMYLSKIKKRDCENIQENYKSILTELSHAKLTKQKLKEELSKKDEEIKRLSLELKQVKDQLALRETPYTLKLITSIKPTIKKKHTTRSQITLSSAKDITSDSIN